MAADERGRTQISEGKAFEANQRPTRFWVTVARGSHPFPSRTRKLSLSAPMVLHARVCGRVGRRPINLKNPGLRDESRGFSLWGPYWRGSVSRRVLTHRREGRIEDGLLAPVVSQKEGQLTSACQIKPRAEDKPLHGPPQLSRTARLLAHAPCSGFRARFSIWVPRTLTLYLREIREQLLSKSAAGQAVNYLLNNWAALTRYCDHPDLSNRQQPYRAFAARLGSGARQLDLFRK